MNTKDLLLLTTLYKEKNITHAAKRLFMTQPALSDRLKKLEQEFNCKIIIREARGISFTSEGEMLVRYFQEALHHYELIKNTLADKNNLAGTLNIACSNVFAKYHMPTILSQFKEKYPHIEITLQSGFSSNRYKDFLTGNFHICIVRGGHNWMEQKYLLWQEPLCLFSKYPVNMKDLADLPYIHYQTDPLLEEILEDWWYTHFKVPPKQVLNVDSMDTCLKLIQQNLGFSFLSQSCGIDTPDLNITPLTLTNNTPLMRDTWLYYRNNYEEYASVKAFVEFIKEKIISPY